MLRPFPTLPGSHHRPSTETLRGGGAGANFMNKSKSLALIALLAVAAPLDAQEVLTNQTVESLAAAGVGDQIIIAKIRSSATSFDVSTDQLINLKKHGVSDNVISAMIDAAGKPIDMAAASASDSPDPKAPHAPGIYMLDESATPAKMVRIDPAALSQMKTGGMLGYAFTGGIAKIKMNMVLPGASARIHTGAIRPTFYFYLGQGSGVPGMPNMYWMGLPGLSPSSPNEFSFIRFDTKKDHREASVGRVGIGGMATGVQDNQRMTLSYADVRPGVFSVTPSSDLAPGEYAFVYSVAGGMNGMSRIFDFCVTSPATAAAAR